MQVLYSKESNAFKGNTGVGLGNFDGLHIGHMALINTVINESKLNGLQSVVYTFTKHPENILRKKLITPLLTTEAKKTELLSQTALDYLYFDEFDEELSRMKPENFVRDILIDKLRIKLAVAGFHYRFGYKGEGDAEFLKELGGKYGFRVIIIPPIKVDNQLASSTQIREFVAKGQMDSVFSMLGRHYSITGEVLSGRRIGNSLGFPTANIQPENYLILPSYGVYITRTLLNGKLYHSLTNIGTNPTFGALDKARVETYILDFDEDIYGKNIEVFFLSRLRGEKHFKNRDELIEQMKKDEINTRKYYNMIISH